MAVFVSASDESSGKDRFDKFVFAGFIASEWEWSELFVPAWRGLVLNGPPPIPNLHMTEIRSRRWQEEHGLSSKEASLRVDRAVSAIGVADFLIPIGLIEKSARSHQESYSSGRVHI